jgi:colanic acid biosynthesis glycosyl transferase WcaI
VRFLLLNQYFWPDHSSVAQLMTDLAEDLVRAGAEVTVITGRQPYTGEERYAPRERWRGVDIIRVPSTRFGKDRLVGRGVDLVTFLAAAALRMIASGKADVVVTISTPPFLPVLGLLRKGLGRSKFVYWVQDLYPDTAVQLGVLGRETVATRALELVSRATLRGADAVITIGDCMADRIAAKGIAPDDIDIVHNWADGEAIQEVPREGNWFRQEHGLEDRFVILYSGNMGRGHAFETLLGAARRLLDRPELLFLFIGGGAKRDEVERGAAELANVRLLPYQPREQLNWSLGAADLAVITLQDEALGVMVPSKLYGHLASARPILYIGPPSGTVARVIQESGCGAVFAHGDVEGVVAFIEVLAADPERARAMGRAGRTAFDAHFGRSRSTADFMSICEALMTTEDRA